MVPKEPVRRKESGGGFGFSVGGLGAEWEPVLCPATNTNWQVSKLFNEGIGRWLVRPAGNAGLWLVQIVYIFSAGRITLFIRSQTTALLTPCHWAHHLPCQHCFFSIQLKGARSCRPLEAFSTTTSLAAAWRLRGEAGAFLNNSKPNSFQLLNAKSTSGVFCKKGFELKGLWHKIRADNFSKEPIQIWVPAF